MNAHLRSLGLVEYEDALRMQELLVLARQQERIPDQVLVVEHPHVYTLGRRAKLEHILVGEEERRRLGIQVHESVRGGDVTYHGPGQIVVYPLLLLPLERQDVGRYVRDLEEVMIRALAELGVTAGRIEGLSGVWVGDDKIGAIGVRMARWVTSHGIALNVNTDLSYFERIIPCGIRDHGVTSLARLFGHPVDEGSVREILLRKLEEVFDLELEAWSPEMRSIQSVVFRRTPRLEALILRRTPAKGGFWQPVTGRIEPGETPMAAAAREVLEETGLSGVVRELGYVHTAMLDPSMFAHAPVPFFVQEHGFSVEVSEPGDIHLETESHDTYRWLPFEEAAAQVRWPGNREGILRTARMLASERGEAGTSERYRSPGVTVRRVS